MDVRDGELVIGRQYLVADRRGRGLPVARGGGDRECVAAGGGGVDRCAIRNRADARRQRRPVRALSAGVARGDELSPGVASAVRGCRDRGRWRGRDLEVDRRGTGLTVPANRGDRIRMSSERRRVERSTRPRRAARVGAALQARAITPLSAREARRYLLTQRERLTIGRRRDRRCRRSRDRVGDARGPGLVVLRGRGDGVGVGPDRRGVKRAGRPRRAV